MGLEVGIAPGELGHEPRQEIGRDGGNEAEPQRPGEPLVRCARQIAELVHGTQDVPDPACQRLSERGEADASGAALEQRCPEHRFQLTDAGGQSRLRDRAGPRRTPEMALLDQRLEVA